MMNDDRVGCVPRTLQGLTWEQNDKVSTLYSIPEKSLMLNLAGLNKKIFF
jgi:hypothetical protein